jgi:hypothetical protein
MSVGRLENDPYPQQLPLLRRGRAKPGFEHGALFRLQPNLYCFKDHLDVESRRRKRR